MKHSCFSFNHLYVRFVLGLMLCGGMTLSTIAQESKTPYFDNLELRYYTGRIQPHHDFMEPWSDYKTKGLELRLGHQTRGSAYWHQTYKYPNIGLTAYWMTMDSDTLGQTGAIAGFMTFPMLRRKRFVTGIELTTGLAIGFNPNDPETNPTNYAIGSYLNAYFNLGGYFDYQISPSYTLSGGAHLVHFSNASSRAPNLGINLLHYHLGLRYHFKYSQDRIGFSKLATSTYEEARGFQEMDQPSFETWGLYAKLLAGFRQTEWTGNNTYGITNFTIGGTYRLIPIFRFQAGIDFMYDAANIQFFRQELNPTRAHRTSDNYFIGTHLGGELIVDRFSIVFHAGYYLLKPEVVFELYGRFGMRWRLNEKWWANVTFKIHNYTTAQYIEWGVGYDIF